MYLLNNNSFQLLCSIQSKFGNIILRSLSKTLASKPVESTKNAHSNLLTNTDNVFEVQHHTVKPNTMVN